MLKSWREIALPLAALDRAHASSYVRAPSTRRAGAGNTELRRGPRSRRASMSAARDPQEGRPTGMSIAAAARRPESRSSPSSARWRTSRTPTATGSRVGTAILPEPAAGAIAAPADNGTVTVTSTQPARHPSMPPTTAPGTPMGLTGIGTGTDTAAGQPTRARFNPSSGVSVTRRPTSSSCSACASASVPPSSSA